MPTAGDEIATVGAVVSLLTVTETAADREGSGFLTADQYAVLPLISEGR